MSATVDILILDLLEWVDARERSYEETIEAGRTSCPRLPVREEANDNGLLRIERIGNVLFVRLTAHGRDAISKRSRL